VNQISNGIASIDFEVAIAPQHLPQEPQSPSQIQFQGCLCQAKVAEPSGVAEIPAAFDSK
jgi:hypothetical protein